MVLYVIMEMNDWDKVENKVNQGEEVKEPREQVIGRIIHIDTGVSYNQAIRFQRGNNEQIFKKRLEWLRTIAILFLITRAINTQF
jgi:hypothetical protein